MTKLILEREDVCLDFQIVVTEVDGDGDMLIQVSNENTKSKSDELQFASQYLNKDMAKALVAFINQQFNL